MKKIVGVNQTHVAMIVVTSLITFSILQLGLLLEIPSERNYFAVICTICIMGISFSHWKFIRNVLFRICHSCLNDKEKYLHTTKLSVEYWSLPLIFLVTTIFLSSLLFNMEWETYNSTWVFMARNSILLTSIAIVCYFSYIQLNTPTSNDTILKYQTDIDPVGLAQELTKNSFILDPTESFSNLKNYTLETPTYKNRIVWCDVDGCKNESAKLGNKQTLIVFVNELFQIKQGSNTFTMEEKMVIRGIVKACFVAINGSTISLSDSIFDHSVKRKSKRKQQILNLFSSPECS